jgi:hypothetical protein
MVDELLNFKITHRSLNLYGICGSCQKEMEFGIIRKQPKVLEEELGRGIDDLRPTTCDLPSKSAGRNTEPIPNTLSEWVLS